MWYVQYLNDFDDEWMDYSYHDSLHHAKDVYERRSKCSYWGRWRLVKRTDKIWFEKATDNEIDS